MFLLLSTDLMFARRFRSVAQAAGLESRTMLSAAQALAAIAQGGVQALCVDLELPKLDIAALVAEARGAAAGLPIVAYGPHVHEQRLAAARAAGCQPVLSRGQFDRDLPALLQALSQINPADPPTPATPPG